MQYSHFCPANIYCLTATCTSLNGLSLSGNSLDFFKVKRLILKVKVAYFQYVLKQFSSHLRNEIWFVPWYSEKQGKESNVGCIHNRGILNQLQTKIISCTTADQEKLYII
ncbi:hypothetical protein KIL84_005119 [Mauremys mutica]|uniref:Uncharacterized protein n=1 Tax=Mauremys mutica TaxID=74926 RepID=A0A9D4B4Q5_9SAUR|nr:hypothetical protein KIL84_005119 [Mauremys mutica]